MRRIRPFVTRGILVCLLIIVTFQVKGYADGLTEWNGCIVTASACVAGQGGISQCAEEYVDCLSEVEWDTPWIEDCDQARACATVCGDQYQNCVAGTPGDPDFPCMSPWMDCRTECGIDTCQ